MAEEALYEAHPSMWRCKPFTYTLMVLMFIGGIAGAYYLHSEGELLPDYPYLKFVSLGASLIGFAVLLYWFIRSKATKLTLTDERTTLKRGIFSLYVTEVFHSDVRNVQLNQTLMQRIFHVGSVGVASAGGDGMEIQVHGMPNPDDVKEIIDKYRRADKSESSRKKGSSD